MATTTMAANENAATEAISADPRERFRGCLLGGAVGDALGAPVEFMSRDQILTRFGPRGITTFALAYGGKGMITDDTQMTLFTAEGLLRAWVRGCIDGLASVPELTRQSYLRWLKTQGEEPEAPPETPFPLDGWLLAQRQLHHRRGPGRTCLEALRDGTGHSPAVNDSKGCGGVMRAAPVGLFLWMPGASQAPGHAFQLATELSGLTHGHPTGQLAAGALAVMVLALVDGASLPAALATAKALLKRYPLHEETLHAIEQAEALARADIPSSQAVAKLGQGWVAEEALAIAVYCALVAPSFRDGIILAVNHDGDSDSTGSIAGNLLGAWHGLSAIPAEWLEPLELRDVIVEVADDLQEYRSWELGGHSRSAPFDEHIWAKYPG
jgi:ADP-ribosylglycohydrolase